METIVKTSAPVFSPKIDFKVAPQEDLERSTIVHCSVSDADAIRIWPTTYLIQDNGGRKKLLHAFAFLPTLTGLLLTPDIRLPLSLKGWIRPACFLTCWRR